MANEVAAQMQPLDLLAPLGCHHYHDRDRNQWEVTLFAANTATVGGRCDGQITPSKFSVDLCELQGIFTETKSVHWQSVSLGPGDQLGAHVSLEADYNGHSVWLRILASAPPHIQTGRTANANTMQIEEDW
jgi:hypothetical protein